MHCVEDVEIGRVRFLQTTPRFLDLDEEVGEEHIDDKDDQDLNEVLSPSCQRHFDSDDVWVGHEHNDPASDMANNLYG